MVSSCVVIGCTQRFSKDSKILFHRFPTKNPSLCRKWLRAIQRKDLHEGNLKYARICSLHFNKDAYLVSASNKLKLKSEMVPKIGLCDSPHQKVAGTGTTRMATRNSAASLESSQTESEPNQEHQDANSNEENSEVTETEEVSEVEEVSDREQSDEEENGVHFQVKEFRSVVPAQFTTSSGLGGPCYILVWNSDNLALKGLPPEAVLPETMPMPSDMQGMESRIRELESQVKDLAESNTRLNQQVELLSESNKDLKKKLKTLQQNKRRLLKRLSTMEGMVNDWKDDRKPFTFCSDDL